MGKRDNLAAGIMTTFIIIIFVLTTYFLVDIFGIIDVPESISLTRFFKSTSEEIVATTLVDEFVVTEDNIDKWINQSIKQEEKKDDIQEEQPSDPFEGTIPEEIPQRDLTSQQVVTTEPEPEPEPDIPVSQPTTPTNATNRMYYYQLDIYGKMIYDRVLDNIENLKTGTYIVKFDTLFDDLLHEEGGDITLENSFQFGMNALLFDHPEIFFLDITKMYMSTEITSFGPLKTYRVSIGNLEGETYLSNTFYSKQDVEKVSEMLDIVKSNVRGRIEYEGPYGIIKGVHDYLIDTISYDKTLTKDNIYNIYGALINREAVCEGYAKSFKFLLDQFGIPCVIVCGTGRNSSGQIESHAWNYVQIDNNWYAIDVTWDDPVIIGDGYVSDSVYEKYFLKGSRTFFTDHIEDGRIVENSNFIYPSLSEENYY